MSLAILHSRARTGIDAPAVTIEVFLSGGLPSFSIVGMAETAVRESKDRVRSALITSGFKWPQERITVNLGPADMPKTGGRFDLGIAVGILIANGTIPADAAHLLHLTCNFTNADRWWRLNYATSRPASNDRFPHPFAFSHGSQIDRRHRCRWMSSGCSARLPCERSC